MKKRKIITLFIALCVTFVLSANDANGALKQSYFKLTTSNGLIVSVFNTQTNKIDYVYPHIFAHIDSSRYVYPFVGNIALNTIEKPEATNYLENTHVITSKYKDFTVYYTASFSKEDKVFYIVARGDKNKIQDLTFNAETVPGSAVSGIDHLENHYQDLPCRIAGNVITGTLLKQYKGNVYEKYFLYSFTDSLHTDKSVVSKAIQQLKKAPASLIDEEVGYMRGLIGKCNLPQSLSTKERSVLEQSISVLKMSQVSEKEIFPHSHGQILASPRPGLWHVAWVRDGSLAIDAMTRLGMYSEARKGLEFMLKAPSNKFRNYVYKDGVDYGPGMDYQISLTRYFGDGTEECDINDHGPNIEYDDFGLFLTTYINYVERSKDWDFYQKWNHVITTKLADVIIHCMDNNGLIKADSGPWEHHLQMPRQYTFSSGVCARGLELFAATQKARNLPYEKYEIAATKLKKAIYDNMLVDNNYFKGNVNVSNVTDYEYWDGGTFEIFANGLVKDKSLFTSHMDAYKKTLTIPGDRLGYVRLPSADPYENQEWVFLNLRVAYAHVLFNNKEIAHSLINYITEQASRNNNLIPEMISNKIQMSKVTPNFYRDEVWCNCIREENDLYIATIPMVGYGAGAYAISILAYHGY